MIASLVAVGWLFASSTPASAVAQQTLSRATWSPGPSATGDNTYVGGIDVPGSGATLSVDRLATLSGWFVDTSALGWTGADDLQVFSGTMDSGTSLAKGTLGLPRSDVASSLNNPYWSAAGWSAVVDPGGLPLGQHALSIYVHTPGKGWWLTQLSVTVGPSRGGVAGPARAEGGPIVTVTAPVDGERISTRLGNYRLTGTARDPVAGPKAIDRIQVWLNGEHDTDQATFIGDANVAPDGSWELDFGPSKYSPLTSNMYFYVHSDMTNKITLVVVHFVLTDRPT
jgi:hypothetical protein